MKIAYNRKDWPDAFTTANQVEVKFSAVVFNVGLPGTEASNVSAGSLRCSPTERHYCVFSPESQRRASQECFCHGKTLVWSCRPAEAAYYSEWLWLTVVSVWPTIRNTDGLKMDTQHRRGGWVHLENKHSSAEYKQDSSGGCVLNTRLWGEVYFKFLQRKWIKARQILNRQNSKINPQRQLEYAALNGWPSKSLPQ